MQVRCLFNRIDQLQGWHDLRHELERSWRLPSGKLTITPGSVYSVYLLTILDGLPWYYIVDDLGLAYPTMYPGPFFDVVDARLSQLWRFRLQKGLITLAPTEWTSDDFYERLLDGDSAAVAAFSKLRQRMDSEQSSEGGEGG